MRHHSFWFVFICFSCVSSSGHQQRRAEQATLVRKAPQLSDWLKLSDLFYPKITLISFDNAVELYSSPQFLDIKKVGVSFQGSLYVVTHDLSNKARYILETKKGYH